MRKFTTILLLLFLTSCGYGNLDHVKDNAEDTWRQYGFETVGYNGYTLGKVIPFTTYGGAFVYYRIKKLESDIVYVGSLQRWGDEIHVYNVRAIDAIRPR